MLDELERQAGAYFQALQRRILDDLSAEDRSTFQLDVWDRPGGGGGRAGVLTEGKVFERAGVNFSDVHGELPPALAKQLPGDGPAFSAMGISLVLHPRSPRIPTVHANLRFLRRGNTAWFGGGTDLTPYYVVNADAVLFHQTLRDLCACHEPTLYPRLKAWCDRYFYLPHRNEPRGVGGIFFDYLGAGAEATAGEPNVPPITTWEQNLDRVFAFTRDLGDHLLDAYLTILRRRRNDAYGDAERDWQLIRRGRYVEFNLVYDRGTLFGLRTQGRTESILMSLPPEVRFRYDHQPMPGSPEAESLAKILARQDWANFPTK